MILTTAEMMEIGFNITYLLVVWGLVIVLYRHMQAHGLGWRSLAGLVTAAFGLLALGDTGHVGFRVAAYAMGGLQTQAGLVGAGALATAVTVTFFYMLMLEAWRVRFNQRHNWFTYLLLAAGVLRLALMALPVNAWGSVMPPQPWSTVRNLPLMLQGLGLAYLILRDAARHNDSTFRWIGVSILVSYACYIPVILLVQVIPPIGMLMIPKTMAYVAIGLLAYNDLRSGASSRRTALKSL